MKNLPKFYIGQKVVYTTGRLMPKNSIHTITEYVIKECGCHIIGINYIKVKFLHSNTKFSCAECGCLCNAAHIDNGWNPKSFAPHQQQNFPLIKLSKIMEKEKEEILIPN